MSVQAGELARAEARRTESLALAEAFQCGWSMDGESRGRRGHGRGVSLLEGSWGTTEGFQHRRGPLGCAL